MNLKDMDEKLKDAFQPQDFFRIDTEKENLVFVAAQFEDDDEPRLVQNTYFLADLCQDDVRKEVERAIERERFEYFQSNYKDKIKEIMKEENMEKINLRRTKQTSKMYYFIAGMLLLTGIISTFFIQICTGVLMLIYGGILIFILKRYNM